MDFFLLLFFFYSDTNMYVVSEEGLLSCLHFKLEINNNLTGSKNLHTQEVQASALYIKFTL